MDRWSTNTQLKEADYKRLEGLIRAKSGFCGRLNDMLEEIRDDIKDLETQRHSASEAYQAAMKVDIAAI